MEDLKFIYLMWRIPTNIFLLGTVSVLVIKVSDAIFFSPVVTIILKP